MDYVTRKNPGGTEYEIPGGIAELMEKRLGCCNAKRASNGLRWEYSETATIFFHKFAKDRSGCWIYILPASDKAKWKTKSLLEERLREWGHPDLIPKVSDRNGKKHLEIKDVPWAKVKEIAPHLVDWVYFNQTGSHAVKLDMSKKKKADFTGGKIKEVNKKLILVAIENLGKTGDVGLSEVYYQMELDSQIGNYELADNWKETVKETLKKMSE